MTKDTKEKDGAEPGILIAGYLDVKLPARSRRRRFGGPWKSWRRHWVEARAAAAADESVAVELVLSAARLSPETAVLRVPGASPGRPRASVCRTASRSRGHAFAIATSTATAGSDASELGALGALGGEVFLAARSEAETERWMAALRAALAAHAASTAATPCLPFPPIRLSAASAASAALLRGRRLSRSEGDLLAAPLHADPLAVGARACAACAACGGCGPEALADDAAEAAAGASTLGRPSPRQPFRLLYGRRRAETLRADPVTVDRLSTSPQSTSGSALSLFGGKIASGLLSAGLGLILSTPGGSETEDNDAEADAERDEEGDEVGVVAGVVAAFTLDRRRESAVSVASGIYEEIADAVDTPPGTPAVVIERVYENAGPAEPRPWTRRGAAATSTLYEDPALLASPVGSPGPPGLADAEGRGPGGLDAVPPPLPPRQNLTPISELLTRVGGRDDGGVDSNGYVQMGRVRLPSAMQSFKKCHGPAQSRSEIETEPTYLPMSPIRPLVLDNRQSSS